MGDTTSLGASMIDLVLASTPAADAQTAAHLSSEECEEKAGFSAPGTAVGLPTSGRVVTATLQSSLSPVLVFEEDEDGELRLGLEPRYVAEGQFASVLTGTPSIRFAVDMPLVWNGHSPAQRWWGNGRIGDQRTGPSGIRPYRSRAAR